MEETQKNLNFILLVVTTPAQPVAFTKHLPRDAPRMGRRSWRVCTLPGFSFPSVASLSVAPAEITWTRIAWQVLSPFRPWRILFLSILTHGLKNRTWVFLRGWLPLQNKHLAQVKGSAGASRILKAGWNPGSPGSDFLNVFKSRRPELIIEPFSFRE